MIGFKQPILVNSRGEWTPHVYVGSNMVTLKNWKGDPISGIQHLYRCTVTDEVRRYGFDAPSAHGESA